MNAPTATPTPERRYELCYRPLRRGLRALAFPCDAGGRVDLDRLDERLRNDYYYARTLIGRDFAAPAVRAGWVH